MPRVFIKTTEELEEFVGKVMLDDSVDIIASDIESNEMFSNEIWHGRQMTLHGIGIYAGKKHQAYIIFNYSIDFTVLDGLFHEYPIVFHNTKFDVPILERHWVITDVEGIQLHDTMLMSFIDKEDRFSHGLKKLTEKILKKDKEEIVEFDTVANKPVRSTEVNLFTDQWQLDEQYEKEMDEWLENMWNYCMDDCEHTYRLYKHFEKVLKKDDALWRVYEKLELPFLKVLMSMEKQGIFLDTSYLSDLEEKAEVVISDLEKKIYVEAGREFDINSPQQLSKLLFEEKGYTPPPDSKTKTWAISTWVWVLTALAEEGSELCKLLLEYRNIVKLQSTYIQALPKLTIDGKVYCNWNQIWTRTWRLASNKPNLQNIPRRDDDFNIRAAFKPKPWNKFIICDYSQAELRVMGYFSQDEWLIEAYKKGEDIHQVTADKMGCSRFIAKTINFGLNYGRTAHGLAKGLGITKEEAQNFIDIYFKAYPKVKLFMEKAVNTVKKFKYIETITKRRRRFDNYNRLPIPKGMDWDRMWPYERTQIKKEMHVTNGKIERMATNTIIQGSASDIIKIAMIKLHERLKEHDAYILLQIHDEVLVECPESKAEEIMKIVQECMEGAVDLKGIPMVAEPKIADEWEK